MPEPGTQLDAVTIVRDVTTVDAEGNWTTSASTTTYTGRGAYGGASQNDQIIAAQRGVRIDAWVIVPFDTDVAVNDRLTVRGHNYRVTDIYETRLHLRVAVRREG